MILTARRILLGDDEGFSSGWLEVVGDRIAAAGTGDPPGRPAAELGGWVVPGFVDIHAHGGGGGSFDDPDAVDTVLAAHRSCGTTTMVASLVTASLPDLERRVGALAERVRSGDLAGIHLEGPWLAAEFHGAHDPALLRDPTPDDVAALLRAGGGAVRMVTIAPERPGALDAIRYLAAHGCVAAVGHTAADHATTRAAVEAGARGATHLFNAMPPLHHRSPGPVLALWADPRVTLELVFDGVHVAPELVAFVLAIAPGRVALITDAMAAAGAADGDYPLGGLAVQVRHGVARVAGTDTIAGSTLTLDRAVRNAVDAGVPLVRAVRAATSVPADHLGLTDVGRLRTGGRADLVVLDEDRRVSHVMARGVWR